MDKSPKTLRAHKKPTSRCSNQTKKPKIMVYSDAVLKERNKDKVKKRIKGIKIQANK